MLARGLKPRQIAAEIGCSLRVIYDWVYVWHDSGIAGLLGGHAGGRYPAMTSDMIATAVNVASAESLTLARIAQKVEDKHGPLPCTLETLANTLKRQGLTYKRARLSLKSMVTLFFATLIFDNGLACLNLSGVTVGKKPAP
ncbi:helix-turn-helix domain-containing protein [Xenorhabdus sp. BG5]|uniref:helix-turn-helix domain-containing protein n=1 Tax=Xenorhabdus sp. BG5 TaxID=2782014 RepID=UPI001D15CD6B|nr:helix-turn-helix domain-containing protein [Xenorhabdus sp. BG5]